MKLIDRVARLEKGMEIIDQFFTEMVQDQLELDERIFRLEHRPSTIIKRPSK